MDIFGMDVVILIGSFLGYILTLFSDKLKIPKQFVILIVTLIIGCIIMILDLILPGICTDIQAIFLKLLALSQAIYFVLHKLIGLKTPNED